MRWSITITKLFGIPVKLHILFLALIIGFSIFIVFSERVEADPAKAFWGILTILLLFLFIFVHELAHSLVAQRFGVRVESITLLPIGGVAQIEKLPETPREEFLITIAGPGTNFSLALILYLVAGPMDLKIINQIPISPSELLYASFYLNILLGAFNLCVPAFPMDGGRILRSLLAQKLGFVRATKIAASLGRIIAFAMVITGLFLPKALLLIVIGLFVYLGATAEEQMVVTSWVLKKERVGNLMRKDYMAVDPNDAVEQVIDLMLSSWQDSFPVVKGGRLVGVIQLDDIAKLRREERSQRLVGDVMRRACPPVHVDDPASQALHRMQKESCELLVVSDESDTGQILGVVTLSDLLRASHILQLKQT
ncbi:MAG: hypothetical protein DRO11_05670 [Methanobacteriota archaeon]|nr:MAG: hypothetical protein DRO11_05670 [Euryarchaeota archaeon]